MFDMDLSYVDLLLLKKSEANLRLKERQLGKQLEKLFDAWDETYKRREKFTNRREKLEKRLMEEAGKVRFLKARKPATSRTPKVSKEKSKWDRALELALAGKLEEAKQLVGME